MKNPRLCVKFQPILLAIVLFAVGCQPSETATTSAAGSIPENAILVGDQRYMIPIGKNDAGCQMYRAFSPNNAVIAAIFYRTADAKFVIDKGKAYCE